MRLIDADALELKRVEITSNEQDTITGWYEKKPIRIVTKDDILNAPTIDAVPVVRCKDCKCWTEWSNGTGSCSRFALDWIGTDANDFCSMGERKDNEID